MAILIRLFIFLSLFFCNAGAEDSILLNADIRMIPKIMALDTQLLSKTKSNKVILAVVYENRQSHEAKSFAERMNVYHNGKVANIPFSAVAVSSDELLSLHDLGCIFLMPMHPQTTAKITAWAASNSIPSFSYNVADLDNGALGSINIERQTVIYISKKVLKRSNLRFNDTLFQIARLVE